MADYKRNHYVPEWYQRHFLSNELGEKKFYHLDLKPETVTSKGHSYQRKGLLRWGPPNCFYESDLYTTKFGSWESTEIEQKLFGNVDSLGESAVEYFSKFQHPSVNKKALDALLPYKALQETVNGVKTVNGVRSCNHIFPLNVSGLSIFYSIAHV